MAKPFRLFVVGASAGGRSAICEFLSTVPKDINAAFAVVVHSAFDAPFIFHKVLEKKSKLKIFAASDDEKMERGCVYVAPPNVHLVVDGDRLKLCKGPRENMFRPAIDVLFRSAGVAHTNNCVGILMTGRLNDGTAGLEAIKKCGGLTIIQNPETAEFGDMPLSAKRSVDIDYVVNLEDLSEVVQSIVEEPLPKAKEVPRNLKREIEIVNKIKSQVTMEEKIGHQVPLSCSSCGGPLWKIEESGIERYRCHVGHAFTQEALLESQNEALEQALWVSMRTLEEKRMLLKRMVHEYSEKGSKSLARSYEDKISEVSEHIKNLREVLQMHD